ncbi:unnamed protein product, partial [Mesorhabditis belari]|uniref:Uncharacterized protein n=1 Tax=Mesorhabditis belari TaxID=2138241 RepID=A0AAF3FE68_9BILA
MPGLHVVGYSFIFYVASPLGAYISASTGQWMMLYCVLLYKFVIMVWFTIQIHHTLKYAQMSAKTKRLQMDLLHALIAQTACPFVMEGTPCLTVHVLAFFSIHISDWCSFFFIPVDLYPLMDALTMIYFIRDYRRVVINNLKKMKLDLSQGTQPKNTGTVENLTGSTNVKTVRTTQTHEATDRTEKDGPSNSSNFI